MKWIKIVDREVAPVKDAYLEVLSGAIVKWSELPSGDMMVWWRGSESGNPSNTHSLTMEEFAEFLAAFMTFVG